MKYYYTVPERVRAAKWDADDLDMQIGVLRLLLDEGEEVSHLSAHEVHFGGKSAVTGQWVVAPLTGPLLVMEDAVFKATYCADPQLAADALSGAAPDEDAADEQDDADVDGQD